MGLFGEGLLKIVNSSNHAIHNYALPKGLDLRKDLSSNYLFIVNISILLMKEKRAHVKETRYTKTCVNNKVGNETPPSPKLIHVKQRFTFVRERFLFD